MATGKVMLLPMPRLSPSMMSGTITKWHVQETDKVNAYDLMLEIETKSLLKITSNEQLIETLDIEILEEAYVAKLCASTPTTGSINVGDVIAILCEDECDLQIFSSIEVCW